MMPASAIMDFSDEDKEEHSKVSSIGSNLDDPNMEYCQVSGSICWWALYQPSSDGNKFLCTHMPPAGGIVMDPSQYSRERKVYTWWTKFLGQGGFIMAS
jgi:hypothetical protein